tara:strand:+ start:2903 stop:3613 length:711 start_codon:yes stop_codon:yes gene_type:complete
MSFEEIIEDIFSRRAQKISGHDPWRYGEELAKKSDEIEFNWLVNNLEIKKDMTIIDVGCGSGRHVIYLATLTEVGNVIGCDFIEKYINFLNDNIETLKLENAKGVIGKATNFVDKIDIVEADIVMGVGVIQYLTSKEELSKFAENCGKIIKNGGSLILKHPLSTVETFVLDYERKEMETRYIAKYYNLTDLMEMLNDYFDLVKIERVFTKENLGEDLQNIERDNRARQMWIHLIRK